MRRIILAGARRARIPGLDIRACASLALPRNLSAVILRNPAILGCMLATLLASAAFAREGDPAPPPAQRLVVATFDEQGVPAGLGDVVSDMLIRAIDAPGYQLLERRQVKRVLEEQAFATSDLTQPGEAVRYGRLADTRFVIVGTVYRVDGVYIVSARMVDSATGVIQEACRGVVQFRTVDEMASRVAELARTLGLRTGPAIVGGAFPAGARDADPPSASGSSPIYPSPSAPSVPSASPVQPAPAKPSAPAASTVRDYLEQVGDASRSEIRLSLEGARGTVEDGAELRFRVESDRSGFLSLFVVNADGAVGMLVPNERVRELPVRPRTAVSVPSDLGFRLLARPPYGATRIKAIVTKAPLPLAGSANAGQALRLVQLGETVGGTEPTTRPDWASAEIEFLVVPKGRAAPPTAPVAPAAPAAPAATEPAAAAPAQAPALRVAEGLPLLFGAAEALNIDDSLLTASSYALLRWPLKSPFDAGIDIGWREPAPGAAPCSVRVGVVDADFDPDDPYLSRSFASITTDVREAMRAEIRRNGRAPFRHGNRVISIIGGEAPWLPGVLPGVPIVPIRITTTVDAPAYRAPRGGADELLVALRRALAAGCRVVNLSLSVPLDADSLRTFQADSVWDELERAGVVVVCAAGNARENLDEHPAYPASLDRPNIVCVGAVGPDGALSSWDGQGSARGSRSVDLVAPGTWVMVSDGGGGSSLACGTSYACAFVTGAAARLMELNPGIPPADVVARLVAGSRPLPGLAGNVRGGLLQWPSQAP